MNPEQKAVIVKLLTIRAEIAGRSFSTNALIQMVEDMGDLDPNAVIQTIRDWGKTKKGFCEPSDIREKVKPEINPEDDALLAANLIIKAVGLYGYTNPERAKSAMGDLAWETVQTWGGWKQLCAALTIDSEGMFRAQLRTLAATVRRKSMRGELHVVPSLPSPANSLISDTMKRLESK